MGSQVCCQACPQAVSQQECQVWFPVLYHHYNQVLLQVSPSRHGVVDTPQKVVRPVRITMASGWPPLGATAIVCGWTTSVLTRIKAQRTVTTSLLSLVLCHLVFPPIHQAN